MEHNFRIHEFQLIVSVDNVCITFDFLGIIHNFQECLAQGIIVAEILHRGCVSPLDRENERIPNHETNALHLMHFNI